MKLSTSQKYFFWTACVAVLLMLFIIIASFFGRIPAYCYMFLRIVTSAALIGLICEKFPDWLKFTIALFIVLYNPIIKINMPKHILVFFNIVTVIFLSTLWANVLIRLNRMPK